MSSAQTGISHVTTGIAPGGQGPQGFNMADVRFVTLKTCLKHSQTRSDNSTAACPAGMIQNCYFAYRDRGLDLASTQHWQVSGCDFVNVSDGYNVGGDCNQGTAYDMTFIDSSSVTITGATFDTFPTGPSNNRVHIGIGILDPGTTTCSSFLIDTCLFGRGGVNAYATTAIQIDATASNIRIGASNFFNGPFTGAMVEDPLGIATAPLGYAASAPSAPSVVPSPGNAASTQPTLGSASSAWQESFSVSHYLQQQFSAPSLPAGWKGWVFFSDNTQTLWAYNGSIKKQLAP